MGKGSGISRSDRRRNARRERLRDLVPREGVVLGIDLGDQKQALALADHDMRVLWRRSPRCAAHQPGAVIADAAAAAAAAGFSRVTVACEPAGSRWMQVQRLCREPGAGLVCIQPLVSHIAREQEDYTGRKRDEPDAVLIARLASELHCYVPEELEEEWACLRQPGRRRGQLIVMATAAVQPIRDWLPVAWPSAVTAAADPFGSMTWLAALEVVTSRCGADPARLAAGLGEEDFPALVRGACPGWGTTRPGRRIARGVLALAGDRDAVPVMRRALFRRVRDEPGGLQRFRRQLRQAEAGMCALLTGLGLARPGDIPGLTLTGAAAILAEAGGPGRCETSSSLVKHAGLSPSDNASGASEGASRISRRGRPSLRLAAWRAVFPLISRNPVMKAKYDELAAGAEESARAAARRRPPGRPGPPAPPGRGPVSRAPRRCCAGSTT